MNRLKLTDAARERGELEPMTGEEEALRLNEARLAGETFEDPDMQSLNLIRDRSPDLVPTQRDKSRRRQDRGR